MASASAELLTDEPPSVRGRQVAIPRPLQIDVLRRALVQNRQFAPVLRGGTICNHYSMAMLAAHGLGAGDDELAQFHNFLDGRSRLPYEELPIREAHVRPDELFSRLGDMRFVAQWRAFFFEELQQRGRDDTLHAYLPQLILGQHKGLFHPMIRLCFALLSPVDSLEETAEALAYSAARHEPLFRALPQCAAELESDDDVAESSLDEVESQMHAAWAELRPRFKSRGYDGQGNSFSVLAQLYQDRDIHSVCLTHFPITRANVEACHLLTVQLALQLYTIHPGLVTLHAVTGGHAIAELLPRLPASTRLLSARLYWIWLTTVFIEKGAPGVSWWADGVRRQSETTWAELRCRALAPLATLKDRSVLGLGDQEPQTHCIKMIYSLDVMCQKRPHPLYLSVARGMASSGRPW